MFFPPAASGRAALCRLRETTPLASRDTVDMFGPPEKRWRINTDDGEMGARFPIKIPVIFPRLTRLSTGPRHEPIKGVFHTATTRSAALIAAQGGQGPDCYICWFVVFFFGAAITCQESEHKGGWGWGVVHLCGSAAQMGGRQARIKRRRRKKRNQPSRSTHWSCLERKILQLNELP